MGRPRLKIDPGIVEKMAAILCTMEEMASILGCSVDTLERRFADVIERGRSQGNMSIRRKQYDLAMEGHAGMLIWLGKQRLGQRDRIDYNDTTEPMIIELPGRGKTLEIKQVKALPKKDE
jgi:AraC-like DNA-binding protein